MKPAHDAELEQAELVVSGLDGTAYFDCNCGRQLDAAREEHTIRCLNCDEIFYRVTRYEVKRTDLLVNDNFGRYWI